METDLLFWMLIILISIELLAIYIISNAIKVLLKSDYFKNKLKRFHEQSEEGSNGKGLLIVLITTGFTMASGSNLYAESVVTAEATEVAETLSQLDVAHIVLASVCVLLLGIILYLKRMMNNLMNIDKTEEEIRVENKVQNSKFVKVLTDSVAIEDEESIDLGHDYDGIRELDNNLPPWWKWGFYLSIVIGILYFGHYHLLKTGDLQEEEYKKEIAQAELDIAAYLKDQAMNVDENTVTFMTDASDIDKGKTLFQNYCAACHEEDGGGRVGPNLTDAYWLHGGRINDIFKTIKYGANNGMKSWKDELNPIQIQQVASFIKSLQGTTPANPKEPEGEEYKEEE